MAINRSSLFRLLLVTGVIFQTAYLMIGAWRDLAQVRGVLGQPALWRSAYFYQGERFARYITFLNENIPLQSRVVLPPAGTGARALGVTPAMQFFLAPRSVLNCLDAACASGLSPQNTSVLLVNDFPGPAAAARFGSQLAFDEGWGLLLPPDVAPSYSPLRQEGFGSLEELLAASLVPLLWLAALTLAGFTLAGWLVPRLPAVLRWSLGYGLGLGGFTLGVALGWLVGAHLDTTTVLLVTGVVAGSGLILASRAGRLSVPKIQKATARLDPWLVALFLLAGLLAAVSMGKGYSVSDEVVLWGAKGRGIAATGSLAQLQEWGTNTTLYPLHVPLLISASEILFSERLPASKLAFSGYWLALALCIYAYLDWKGLRRSTAGLASLLLATAPLVFRHATLAYANLSFGFYLLSAVILMVEALRIADSRAAVLSSLFFCATAWTRPEGLAITLVCMCTALGLTYMRQQRPTIKTLVALFIPLVSFYLFWAILREAVYTQPAGKASLLPHAFAQVLGGKLHPEEAAYIVRSLLAGLFSPPVWGGLGILLVAALLFSMGRGLRGQYSLDASLFLASGVACAVAILGLYYITSYDTVHDISWWVSTGLGRMAMPAMFLLWLGAVLWAEPLDHGEDRPLAPHLEDDRRPGIQL
jgi:hypothetical protein